MDVFFLSFWSTSLLHLFFFAHFWGIVHLFLYHGAAAQPVLLYSCGLAIMFHLKKHLILFYFISSGMLQCLATQCAVRSMMPIGWATTTTAEVSALTLHRTSALAPAIHICTSDCGNARTPLTHINEVQTVSNLFLPQSFFAYFKRHRPRPNSDVLASLR